MAYEFIKTMPVQEYALETPMAAARGYRVVDKDRVLIILVLRAAIPFVEGLYKMFPLARTGIVSAWRGPPPQFSVEINYVKIPPISRTDIVLVADPMLATGHTLVEVARNVLEHGRPKRLVFLTVVSCPDGIQRIVEAVPEAEIYTCAVDPELNSKGYIVPGLGDAGDRAFGSSEEHAIA
jgi:uracil phosphoribosyltransferase